MITLKVLNLKRFSDTDMIFNVTYSASLNINGKRVGLVIKNINLDESSGEFIEFADLTEDVIIEWLFAKLGDTINEIEEELTIKYNNRPTPPPNPILSGLPWKSKHIWP